MVQLRGEKSGEVDSLRAVAQLERSNCFFALVRQIVKKGFNGYFSTCTGSHIHVGNSLRPRFDDGFAPQSFESFSVPFFKYGRLDGRDESLQFALKK